jgi:hypothetical protein
VFASPEEYEANQTGDVKFDSRSFIPSGLFPSGGDKPHIPQAYAIFTGHVRKTQQRKNDLTGCSFCWALVETLGGTFDVVIDLELLGAAPRVGGVLTGAFWLSGRLVDDVV